MRGCMTVLILSDTHRNRERLKKVLDLHRDADAIIHLGDGYGDFAGFDLGDIPLYRVRGNCDEESDDFGTLPDECIAEIGGVKIMMVHGHRYGVKEEKPIRLMSYAAEKGVDVVLFGHTHIPMSDHLNAGDRIGIRQVKKTLHIFNPGSLGNPQDGGKPSFGVLTIRGGQILLSHGQTDY